MSSISLAIKSADPPHLIDRGMAFVSVELLNLWSNFVKAYYLSSVNVPRTQSGRKIIISNLYSSHYDLLRVAANYNKPARSHVLAGGKVHRRDEPTWHDPNVFIGVCASIGHSDLSTVIAAISGMSKTLRDMPTYRNYFAHRNKGTQEAALSLALSTYGIVATRPADALLSFALHRPVPLVIDWLEDVRFTVEYICY